MIMHSAALLRDENAALRAANEAASKRKSIKRKRLQKQGVLTQEEALELDAQKGSSGQKKGGEGGEEVSDGGTARKKRRCKRCGEVGHNSRTCQAEV